jgi:outer membrane protein assembly factor BamB
MKWYEAPLVPRTWIAATNSDSGTRYFRTPSEYDAGKGYYRGRRVALNEPPIAAIKALDPETGDVKWQ